MTRSIGLALRAKNPDAVAQWEAATDAAGQEFIDKCKAYMAKTGASAVLTRAGFSGEYAEGITFENVTDELPAGWRRDRSNRSQLLPALKTKEGKAHRDELSDIRFTRTPAPGLPQTLHGEGRMGIFHVEKLGEGWYATLGFMPSSGYDEIDGELWEAVPLSVYYTALEAEHPAEVPQ